MRSKGTHTIEIYLYYHRCPKCGWIIENRDPFENRLGSYQKDLTCPKCMHFFTDTKKDHKGRYA